MIKIIIFVAQLLAICLATDTGDLSVAESARPLLKPSGKPFISADPVVTDTASPTFEYISTPDVTKPAIDYISVPRVISQPKYEYINTRPSGYEYVYTYPGYQKYGYNPYPYTPYRYSYAPTYPQSGYQTGYQNIRYVEPRRQPVLKSYPIADQTYYPINSGYNNGYNSGYNTGYNTYDYRYYPQYLPSLGFSSYLPLIYNKKK